MQSLIVFSHLRWDFVYQRPQHLMVQLAKRYRIFFIEEPVFGVGASGWLFSTPYKNVRVCRPHTAEQAAGFHDEQIPSLQLLINDLLEQESVEAPIIWFYTPMALPLISELRPAAIIYDCMDELAAFKGAPRQLLQREQALLRVADLVFTGGRSLYETKRHRHDHVHCFPSSVDQHHFGQAFDPALDHELQRPLPHPRLGFFGVLDERLDVELVRRLARRHPEWSIVMVGPVVKIERASLPLEPNIFYFGQQSYDELPALLAGWDVAIMPFALNESTAFISPTKTLEYMAGGKPIVSTPIRDVVATYGDLVGVGQGDLFVQRCEEALSESNSQRLERQSAMREAVQSTSWEVTAASMGSLIDNLLPRGGHAIDPPSGQSAPRTIVIGAGPTGLSAALHLGAGALLLEQQSSVGGWCRSIDIGGFTFDYAGHIMFSNDPYVHELYERLLGTNVHWQDREAWIYSKNVYTRYPFQGALYGLPAAVVSECLVGAIKARESFSTAPQKVGGDSNDKAVPAQTVARTSPANFEQFIHQVWGSGIAAHFAVPYNKKLWTVPLDTMETSWLGGRVPLPNLTEMIDGALSPSVKPMGPNARFGYPLKGGFQALMNGFLPLLDGPLETEVEITRIIPSRRVVMSADGVIRHYERLISTMPLPKLIEMMGTEVPWAVRQAASLLRHVSIRCVNLGIARSQLTEKHWIYYPEDTVFHRIFVQGNASPHCNPPGGCGLTCEISYSPLKPLPCEGENLIDLCIEDCVRVGIIDATDAILVRHQVDLPYAYVVYDHARATAVTAIKRWAATQGITLAGRYSEWEYYNSDHAFLAGKRAAELVRADLWDADLMVDDGAAPAMTEASATVLTDLSDVGR